MTPEEYADTIIARLTMEPQGRWDADVVEFETKSADIGEVKAWIAEAIRRAMAEALAAVPYNRPCDCGSGLMVRICSLCLERARSAAVAEEREACAAAMCEGCRLGERVTLVEGFPYHAAPAAIAPGPHGEPCDAAAIRARGAP